MTFGAVGRLVGGLPRSAFTYREWWGNNAHSHAASWAEAGCTVASVDIRGQRVSFGRVTPREPVPTGRPRLSPEPSPVDSVSLDIELEWSAAGAIVLDDMGDLRFPAVPQSPGLYRITLVATDRRRPSVYVGETEQLPRRLYGYRRPGPSQYTNQRLNRLVRVHLEAGAPAQLALATHASVTVGRSALAELDFTIRSNRLLAENAALCVLKQAGDADIVNLG